MREKSAVDGERIIFVIGLWWGHGICIFEEDVPACISVQEALNCCYALSDSQASDYNNLVLDGVCIFIIVESNISLYCLLVGVLFPPTLIFCGELLVCELLYLFELRRSVMHSWLINYWIFYLKISLWNWSAKLISNRICMWIHILISFLSSLSNPNRLSKSQPQNFKPQPQIKY